MGHGGGRPRGGEADEDTGDERVEQNGGKEQLGPHLFVSSPENIFVDPQKFVIQHFQKHEQRIQKTDLSS